MTQAALKPICTACDSAEDCGFVRTTGRLMLECDHQRGFQGLYLVTNGSESGLRIAPDTRLISRGEVLRAAGGI